MNFLFCSVGRRCELLNNFKKTLGDNVKIVATDASPVAPALYFADKTYIVSDIDNPGYIDCLLDICKKENIQVVTTLIDPEIAILAENRERFAALDIEVLAPDTEAAKLCFDKSKMYEYLKEHAIPTVNTYGDILSFMQDFNAGKIGFPVFVKPRNGSGSVGARKIEDMVALTKAMKEEPKLIIQEYMGGSVDLDADVYIDTISHKPVSIFSKKKLSTTIGGANKTVSFKDDKLVKFICDALVHFKFNGPIDIDFFYKDSKYYLSEINPRFGGAYLHAYGAGVDFVKLIDNNIKGIENKECFGNYEDDVVMMMYDSVVIRKREELVQGDME